MNPNTLLEVAKLSVSASSSGNTKELVHDVSFNVHRGEVLIILGESGSGKTILSRSLTELFPVTSPFRIDGSALFEGQQILSLDDQALMPIRRRRIRYVFQEPVQALNPLSKIKTQLRLASVGDSSNDDNLHDVLRLVGIENSKEVMELYPHQLSIGMAQRVCIAMAVLPSPSLLIADEPTSAVDASLRYKLIDLLMSIQRGRGMSLVLITHDMDIARSYGDRIVVMYGGRIVESAPREAFFHQQLHPYSKLLVASQSALAKSPATSNSVASPLKEIVSTGCKFHPRCPIVKDDCRQVEPTLEKASEEREVRCFYWK